MVEGRRRRRRERSRGEEETETFTESSISEPKLPPRGRAHFFAYRKWATSCPRWANVDDDDDDDDIRFCARIRIAVVSPSSAHPPSVFFSCPCPPPPPLLFLSVRCPLESIPLDSFLTLAVGRSIATSADSALLRARIYLLVFPIYFAVQNWAEGEGGEGEPDLSPLNGINKLYYACTSP